MHDDKRSTTPRAWRVFMILGLLAGLLSTALLGCGEQEEPLPGSEGANDTADPSPAPLEGEDRSDSDANTADPMERTGGRAAGDATESPTGETDHPPRHSDAEPGGSGEASATADADFAAGIERVRAMERDARFVDAYQAARVLRRDFADHPEVNELDALIARLKDFRRDAGQLPYLMEQLTSGQSENQAVARRRLAGLGEVAGIYLQKMVREGSAEQARQAAAVLAGMRHPGAEETMIQRLRDATDPALRAELAGIVVDRMDRIEPASLAPLAERMMNPADADVRPIITVLAHGFDHHAQREPAVFDEQLGRPGAAEALIETVRRGLRSEDDAVVRWASALSGPVGLTVRADALVLWLNPLQNLERDASGRVARWGDARGHLDRGLTQPEADQRPEPAEDQGRAAIRFAGDGDFLVDPDAEDYLAGLDGCTLAVWVRSEQTETDRGVLYGLRPNGQDDTLTLRYDAQGFHAGGRNLIRIAHHANGKHQIETADDTQTTDWQFITATWQSGQTMRVYLDGQPHELSHSPDPVAGALGNIDRLIVGKSSKDDGGRSWQGLIGAVWIYDQPLTAEEVATLYEASRKQ